MKKLPNNNSVMTDTPADTSTSVFAPMGSGTREIVTRGLVARSGHPEVGMTIARFATGGRCETCQLDPYQPAQDGGHPYVPITNRVPGVHGSIDDPGRAPRNYDPAISPPGEQVFQVDDPALNDASARFRQRNSRHVPYQPGEGPFPVL